MIQDQRPRQGFEERLLTELKRVVVFEAPAIRSRPAAVGSVPPRRRAWRRRTMVATGLAAAFAIALAAVLPTLGGERGSSRAYAVTENRDGTITVEIVSIEDAAGLERKLEEAGVPASVHYLPAGKVCAVKRGPEGRKATPEIPVRKGFRSIGMSADGAFTVTVDRSTLTPGATLVIDAQYAAPEHGQQGETVASIGAIFLEGDHDDCELVDGSIEGWTFQEGGPPGEK